MMLDGVVLWLETDPAVDGVDYAGSDGIDELRRFIDEKGGRAAFRLTHDEEAEW